MKIFINHNNLFNTNLKIVTSKTVNNIQSIDSLIYIVFIIF